MTGDELAARISDGSLQVLDVRSAEEYSGAAGYGCDPRQGHIPGAVNIDLSELAAPGADVRDLLAAHGLDSDRPIVCYCHSGSRSAYAVSRLAAAGVSAENYEGSWHEWSHRAEAAGS